MIKKEHRKSDTHVVEALGPALFSTPDIIRRVGSTETKAPDSPVTTSTAVSINNSSVNEPIVSSAAAVSTPSSSTVLTEPTTVANILDDSMENNVIANDSSNSTLTAKLDDHSLIMPDNVDDKMDTKTAIAELLQPALDSGKYNYNVDY